MSEVSGPTQGLMNIEEEARPPFAVLPDSSALFPSRSKRLAALEALETMWRASASTCCSPRRVGSAVAKTSSCWAIERGP